MIISAIGLVNENGLADDIGQQRFGPVRSWTWRCVAEPSHAELTCRRSITTH